MVSVPGFLLRRLYAKGSLRNNQDGFQFQLRNTLGSGYARRLHPLTVDGEAVPLERASFLLDGVTTPFADVSEAKPFTLALNRDITILVKGKRLQPGPHKVGMGFDVPGFGTLAFDFTDAVAEG